MVIHVTNLQFSISVMFKLKLCVYVHDSAIFFLFKFCFYISVSFLCYYGLKNRYE